MMSSNEQELRAIAYLAARCRPTGAKPWDEAGIVANLRKVAHINLAELTMATIRAAANKDADSPGVIPVTTGEHWREKVRRDDERRRFKPPRKHEECPTHPGWYADHCAGCLSPDAWDFNEPSPPPTTKDQALTTARAALRNEGAGDE